MCYCAPIFHILALCFFYCLCIACVGSGMTLSALVVIWEVKCEYISVTTAVLHCAKSVMHLQPFFDFYFSLCQSRSLCFVRYCLAPGHVWSDKPPPTRQPYTKPAYHHMLAPDMQVNKHTHIRLPPFPHRQVHIPSFPTLSPIWPPSTPKRYS